MENKTDGLEEIKETRKKLKKMTMEEKIDWLKNIHDDYVEQVKIIHFGGSDFLSGTDTASRIHIVYYMNQIVNVFHVLEIEGIETEIGNKLLQDGYSNLFLILNILNFL